MDMSLFGAGLRFGAKTRNWMMAVGVCAILFAACGDGAEADESAAVDTPPPTTIETTPVEEAPQPSPDEDSEPETEVLAEAETPEPSIYFSTLGPGTTLPTEQECAALVSSESQPETHPDNREMNASTGGPTVSIDGADEVWNAELAPRITGNFAGTTEDLLRWVSCKWGFDEDFVRARAWTESSWRVTTAGDETDDVALCSLIGLDAPCSQSYGLLQVKGTVHEGTFPYSFQSSAWGLDYAMAWQRACLEGSFVWLEEQGYEAGDEAGCAGSWFSGEWYDEGALGYLDDVNANLASRPWDEAPG